MIWDKVFWVWFLFTALLALVMLLEDASTLNMVFGSMVIGLGLIKLAGERSGKSQPLKVSRKLLDKLKK